MPRLCPVPRSPVALLMLSALTSLTLAPLAAAAEDTSEESIDSPVQVVNRHLGLPAAGPVQLSGSDQASQLFNQETLDRVLQIVNQNFDPSFDDLVVVLDFGSENVEKLIGPEPGTLVLLGLLGPLAMRRKRRKRAETEAASPPGVPWA